MCVRKLKIDTNATFRTFFGEPQYNGFASSSGPSQATTSYGSDKPLIMRRSSEFVRRSHDGRGEWALELPMAAENMDMQPAQLNV
ncbi:hypothetical protein AtubIFM55763_000979 [Aspergillus tubingensis]|nr:hypothetical protein AtubIFM55763_000979 [Aspergillus tubingensis]